MKKLLLLVALTVFAAVAYADEITFSYVVGAPGTLTASRAGYSSGPSASILVTDVTTNVSFTLNGTFNNTAGPATSFIVSPGTIAASFAAGGAGSVSIVSPSMSPLVTGVTIDGSSLLSQIPDGAGAFLGTFDVAFVDPAVLALFHLGPAFDPVGSVSTTFAHDNFDTMTGIVTGQLGGGTVTITTPTPVIPEPGTLGLAGLGGVTLFTFAKRKYHRNSGE